MQLLSALITISCLLIGAASAARIPVDSGSSSAIYSSLYLLKYSWDPKPHTFFHSKSSTNGWAKYYIPNSKVDLVRLQNRGDCCEQRMTGNIVYVCADKSDASCKECGRVTGNIKRGGMAEIRCSLTGTVVKVVSPKSYLQIATIEVYGTPATTPAPTPVPSAQLIKVPVNSGSSSAIYNSRYLLKYSWDTKPDTFFHSRSSTNGWAKYYIPKSTVAVVKMQNRKDCCEGRMTGNKVYVCASQSDNTCQDCGKVYGIIGRSAWAEIRCFKPIEGTVVKVVAPNSYLQIAKIEILAEGKTTPAPIQNLVKLKIRGGSCSTPYGGKGSRYGFPFAYDNDDDTFYHAGHPKIGWARFNIPRANVGLVRLQNRKNCCEDRMTGNVVYVCTTPMGSSCKECGRVTTKIGRSAWAEIRCSLPGSFVKVAATNSYLQIAEIEVWALQ